MMNIGRQWKINMNLKKIILSKCEHPIWKKKELEKIKTNYIKFGHPLGKKIWFLKQILVNGIIKFSLENLKKICKTIL